METTYISAKEASDYTGLSQRRINQLVADGTLPSIRIGNSNAIERGPALRKLVKKNGNKKAGK
jgi:excisionase family DNA binding protein